MAFKDNRCDCRVRYRGTRDENGRYYYSDRCSQKGRRIILIQTYYWGRQEGGKPWKLHPALACTRHANMAEVHPRLNGIAFAQDRQRGRSLDMGEGMDGMVVPKKKKGVVS